MKMNDLYDIMDIVAHAVRQKLPQPACIRHLHKFGIPQFPEPPGYSIASLQQASHVSHFVYTIGYLA